MAISFRLPIILMFLRLSPLFAAYLTTCPSEALNLAFYLLCSVWYSIEFLLSGVYSLLRRSRTSLCRRLMISLLLSNIYFASTSLLEKLVSADCGRLWLVFRAKLCVSIMLAALVSLEKVVLASTLISDSARCDAGDNRGKLMASLSKIASKIRAPVARSLRAYC